MIRTVFAFINHLFWTGLMGTIAILVSPLDTRGKMIATVTRLWAYFLLKGCGVPFRVRGLEKLDRGKYYIFAANHESAIDIPLVFAALPFQVVSMAKKELKKIPILGWAMTRARHVFVDRKNHRRAVESLAQAVESLKEYPRSVIVFPEGTRSTDGEIHRFKKGGLGLAVDLGIPVVPMAVCGTRDILSPHSPRLRPGTIELRIGSPIETSDWAESTKSKFAEYVREQVASLKATWLSEKRGNAEMAPA
ncbi:MAG: lysophospholipid acyltransferase family protein [Candidatus Neomarinimicrobiota bacterium]